MYDTYYQPYYTTDPTLRLTGEASHQAWRSPIGVYTNQRFHIDLGSAKIIKRIYYENYHTLSYNTVYGIKNFTFWGSNDPSSFADLVYGNDAGWTQIPTAVTLFDIHVSDDIADPKYILITNTTAYRYYAFKFADTYYSSGLMGVRRIELQVRKGRVIMIGD
jgi:hypothetical protein